MVFLKTSDAFLKRFTAYYHRGATPAVTKDPAAEGVRAAYGPLRTWPLFFNDVFTFAVAGSPSSLGYEYVDTN